MMGSCMIWGGYILTLGLGVVFLNKKHLTKNHLWRKKTSQDGNMQDRFMLWGVYILIPAVYTS